MVDDSIFALRYHQPQQPQRVQITTLSSLLSVYIPAHSEPQSVAHLLKAFHSQELDSLLGFDRSCHKLQAHKFHKRTEGSAYYTDSPFSYHCAYRVSAHTSAA
jgi:hypothetical protein